MQKKSILIVIFNFHRRIPNVETYTMSGLYPDTLYYIWLAARSQRGEGKNESTQKNIFRMELNFFASSF